MKARTLFLSDIHLGFKRSRVRELADFLRGVEAECIVLVGDIVDALSMARHFFWSEEHTTIIRVLLAKQRAGARVIYIPGNHDASLAIVADMLRGQVEVHREWVHRTARGQRLLVLHGDQFDEHVEVAGWLKWLGCTVYDMSVALSDRVNDVRRRFNQPYWSFIESLKLKIGTSARYIERFERSAVRYARMHGFDGVVCGHIHRANLCHIEEVLYCNTGDWVESCSALIEDHGGELHLVRWPDASAEAKLSARSLEWVRPSPPALTRRVRVPL